MPDNPSPPRRWFQFRLSTWFVLVAILAWAMIEWPWVVTRKEFVTLPTAAPAPSNHSIVMAWGNSARYSVSRYGFNPNLIWPAIVSAVFLLWKSLGRIHRRSLRMSLQVAMTFVVLTALFAFEAHWIHQRHEFLGTQETLKKEHRIGASSFGERATNHGWKGYVPRSPWYASVAFVLLQEERHPELYIVTGFYEHEPDYLPTAEWLFPEANTIHWARAALSQPDPDPVIDDVIFDRPVVDSRAKTD